MSNVNLWGLKANSRATKKLCKIPNAKVSFLLILVRLEIICTTVPQKKGQLSGGQLSGYNCSRFLVVPKQL